VEKGFAMLATRWLRSWRGVLEVLGLSAIFALVLGCPGSAEIPSNSETVPIDKQVTFAFDGKGLVVEPAVFLAKVGGPGVEFRAKGLPEGYTLEIDFTSQANTKGPFVKSESVRGRYEILGRGNEASLQSGKVDTQRVKAGTYWKYEVVVRDREKNDLVAIDPGGVFK
jgi:hypothetical protein